MQTPWDIWDKSLMEQIKNAKTLTHFLISSTQISFLSWLIKSEYPFSNHNIIPVFNGGYTYFVNLMLECVNQNLNCNSVFEEVI